MATAHPSTKQARAAPAQPLQRPCPDAPSSPLPAFLVPHPSLPSLLEVAAAPYGLGFWLLPAAPGWALARGGAAAVLQPPASPRGAPERRSWRAAAALRCQSSAPSHPPIASQPASPLPLWRGPGRPRAVRGDAPQPSPPAAASAALQPLRPSGIATPCAVDTPPNISRPPASVVPPPALLLRNDVLHLPPAEGGRTPWHSSPGHRPP
mmetsp:Transcript_46553/g.101340  ORF Transcript_46553/g.101340 Transcript_46553/m.101340 type:complete len:208 (-) Transcript_46553:282-905(-)